MTVAQQLDSLRRDMRHAARALLRTPTFAAVAILCFAIGIGVNATMFGIVNALLFRAPPHVHDAADVFRLDLSVVIPGHSGVPQLGGGRLADFDYHALRAGTRTLDVAAYVTRDLTLGRGAAASAARVTFATPSYFRLLGVRPVLGRFFAGNGDSIADGAPVTVLSFGLWQRRFGADSGVVGRTLHVGRGMYTIVGVAPKGFRGTDFDAVELWLPTSATLHELFHDDVRLFQGTPWLHAVVRRHVGISTADAAADASRVFQLAYSNRFGARFRAIMVATLEPVIAGYGGTLTKDARVSLWLAGVSVIVLLVAAANVANLLLARTAERRREIAIRLALGVGRGRLARHILAESLLLSAAGGMLALLLAWWGSALVRRFLASDLQTAGGIIDGRILGFAALAAIVTALLCALLPMRHAARTDVLSGLKAGARDSTGGRSTLRTSLLVAQVALTMVLLVGAGLFARSLRVLRTLDLGMDSAHLVIGRMALSSAGYSTADRERIMQRAQARVGELPGVRATSRAFTAPFLGARSWPDFIIPAGQAPAAGTARRNLLDINNASPGFFATVGTPLVRGRAFTRADEESGRAVAIINETMAKAVWPNGDAVGKCIKVGGMHGSADSAPCSEIIGVVRDTHARTLRESPRWEYFAPWRMHNVDAHQILLVRTAGDPRPLVPAIRRAMQTAGADLPSADVQTMTQIIAPQMRPWRLGTIMFGLFGAIALALALCGLYGVFSYAVQQRQQEIGVRMALGARSGDVAWLIVGEGVRASALGVVLGLIGAIAAGRALASLLVGIPWLDIGVLAGTSLLVLVTAMMATYLPARRAGRVDPVALLRTE